ncbi:TRAP transporter large permease [Desulfovibrio sp. OttesenSCG-928-I05]|nr:TRAP transporter large permease [Desulfovibrio sp. OttesenSCG-928-I05]
MMLDILVPIISIAAVALFVFGVPILVVIGLWSICISYLIDLSLANVGVTLYEGLNFFGLLAMPLFILTGDMINAAGIARKLTNCAHACLGWLRGGFGMATLGACGIFAAISGSNAATAATIGSIMYPKMIDDGYEPTFAAATIASGGTVGIIIPPSIIFITYGFLLNLPINDLFTAGSVPGILMVLSMMAACYILARKNGWGTLMPFSPKAAIKTTLQAYLGFLAILLIIYGIYSGSFSPTESAAMCVGFCFFAGLGITRELSLRKLPNVLFNSGKMVGMVAPLVAMSIVMQQCLSALGIEKWMASTIGNLGYTGVMLSCMVIIFIAGMFLESVPVVTILAPILAPIAHSVGVDPIHFGVIMLVGTAVGFITPPFGLNLFVVSTVTGLPFTSIIRYIPPYLIALLVTWFAIVLFPSISLFML